MAPLGSGSAPGDLVGAVRQVALGLAAIHAAGAIHRDVRPENLFRCSDGTLKVWDLATSAEVRTLTHTGSSTRSAQACETR